MIPIKDKYKKNLDVYTAISKAVIVTTEEIESRLVYHICLFSTMDRYRSRYWSLVTTTTTTTTTTTSSSQTTIKANTADDLVGWECRMHRLHLCWGVRSYQQLSTVKVNHLMVRFESWRFGKFGVPLHCHYSLLPPEQEWLHLLESCQ